MHDRAVVIWAVEIVCHMFSEVIYIVCQKTQKMKDRCEIVNLRKTHLMKKYKQGEEIAFGM